jgi:hypothetical protein
MARYLCVLVSGYVEKALQELTIEWCRKQSGPTVVKYASTHLRHLQNLNSKRLREVLGAFEASWSDALDSDYPEEISALDSVYGNRNQIAHGGNVGLTLIQVERYYEGVDRIVDYLIALMDPA